MVSHDQLLMVNSSATTRTNENSMLKSELRQIEIKNRSFENELNELKKIIKNKDKEIEDLIYLKDSQHHG